MPVAKLPGPVVFNHAAVNNLYRKYKRPGSDREEMIKTICEGVKTELENYSRDQDETEEKRSKKKKKKKHVSKKKSSKSRKHKRKVETSSDSSSNTDESSTE